MNEQGFKSGYMLNLAYQIRQANKRYKTKDPLKRPAILFITQENLVSETVDRLFSLAVAKDTKDRLKNYKVQDAIKLLKTKGRMKLTKENNIDIIIMYKPAGTIDTSDVLAEIENLEEEGVEVVALFHDYIKKIRSINPNKDLRLEMQNIVQEFKVIAVDKQIPVFLANQLNRDARKTIDAALECKKTDLARFLGSSNVSESWGVIEESDCVMLINKERMVSTGQLFLSIKRLKIRYGSDDSIDYFNHPFLPNEFGLVEDVQLEKSVSIKSLTETLIGEHDEDEIEFGKRGEAGGKKRKEKGKKEEKQRLSLQEIESVFSSAA